jgi:FKBP-type peptidyl-prolyl cis-trans isomerase
MRPTHLLILFAISNLTSCALIGITDKVEVDHPLRILEGGIGVQEIVMGQGPQVETGQEILIDYTGYLSDGEVFDSSLERGVPLEFTLGEAPLPGWNEGILGMRAGGQRHVSLPPEQAYGEAGVAGLIPPNEPLVFEIWLLDIK